MTDLLKLAERVEAAALSDAEHAANSPLFAVRAANRFAVAAALRAHHAMQDRDMSRYTELIIPMLLTCPSCGQRHIDEGEFATKVHYTHACQHCGMVWRPAIAATVGVRFLPGFKNEAAPEGTDNG